LVTPGPLKYAEFEVELDADGFPIVLGIGAMAITYRARDTILNSTVALKVIGRKLALDPTARARFLQEARAAAQIRHANVARVLRYGEQDGECFYAMELVKGETLEARVRRDGPLPLPLALEVIEQVARAVVAAETCGVVHRDIKPSNIMIESDPSDVLVVKVIDYGVAKIMTASAELGSNQTQAGFIGTPAFASPEQFDESRQPRVDTRSDIYSLGITLWYLLSGHVPFIGRTLEEIRLKQASELPLQQLKNARLPAPVVALLRSMLAVDPNARPQSPRELLAALRRCSERFNPAARAQRRRTLLIQSLLVLSIVAIGLGSWWYQHSQFLVRRERSIAVLPFENLSSEKENTFFADGVQDEIITDLAKIAELKVISRSSVMQYKGGAARKMREIGEQLGVAHLLEGSVQRAANKIRVSAKLIDIRTDELLWAQTYDRDLADVFAIQSEIAESIAGQLQARLSPNEKTAIEKPPTNDLEAFDLYTRAKTLLLSLSVIVHTEQTTQQAVELLNQAVARDPTFAEAYYQLVYAHGYAYSVIGDHTPARLALAEAALQAASRLRPEAGETHRARAIYLYSCLRDYNGALGALEVARRSLRNDSRLFELSGYILRRRGQQEEGARNLERAVEIDPRNIFILQQLALSYQYLRRYPEEAAVLSRCLAIVPNDAATKANRALVDFNWKAKTRPLHEAIDSILANNPGTISEAADIWFQCALAERDPNAAERALVALGDNPCWGDSTVLLSRSFGEGLLARMMKDEPKAQASFSKARLEQEKIVQAQPDYGPALCVLGLIDASLGRKEAALREGQRAIELLPVERDSISGSQMLVYFAMMAAWVGEKDTALQYLAANAQLSGGHQVATHGALMLLPFWDPLRGDPRFEALVKQLAPTEVP
jgi:Serine/threonine protein kinase